MSQERPIEDWLGELRKHLGTIRQIAGEQMLSQEDGGLRSGYPAIRTIAAIALAILKDMEAQEPVANEDQELADHYLYMGWLGARPDRPWTDEDAREAFLHALKYARAHPSPSTPVDIAEMIKAGDAQHEALRKAEQDLRDWKRLAIALRGESEEGLQRGIEGCMPHRAGIEHTSRIADACYQAKNAWTDATAKHRTT